MSSAALTGAPRTPPTTLAARRRALAARLSGPALVVAGQAQPRNYLANTHPFRAESPFLWLVGRHLEGAALLLDGETHTLFVEEGDADQRIWHGPSVMADELRAATGIDAIEGSARLEGWLSPSRWANTATLAAHDVRTAGRQSALLQRPVAPIGLGVPWNPADHELAGAMVALRLRHDEHAIEQMRWAASVTARAHHAILRCLASAMAPRSTADARADLEAEFTRAATVAAYPSIITPEGEILHATAKPQALSDRDLLLVDAGAESHEGWASDVTRVYPCGGRFSATQRALYDVVLAAQRAAISAVRVGTRYRDVHRRAARVIVEGLRAIGIFRGEVDGLLERDAAAVFFPHGVGHLLGLDVHDMEAFGDLAGYAPGRTRATSAGERFLRLDRDLEAGMVVTIEPGFYRIPELVARARETLGRDLDESTLSQFDDVRGIRIEDDVWCQPEGPVVLTSAIPCDAAEIERRFEREAAGPRLELGFTS